MIYGPFVYWPSENVAADIALFQKDLATLNPLVQTLELVLKSPRKL